MIQVRASPFATLDPAVRACWEEWQRARPEWESPFFRPEFAAAVEHACGGVEVGVAWDQGTPAAVLPFQRSRWNLALPVAGRLCDFHGPLVAPGRTSFDLGELLRGCGVRGWEFHGAPEGLSDAILLGGGLRRHASPYLDLAEGFAAYCRAKHRAGSETVEKTLRKAKRMIREQGARFELRTERPELLETLLDWKLRQHAELGVLSPLRAPGARRLFRVLHERSGPRLEGLVSVLWAGERPAAIGFTLRSGDVAHCCLARHDAEFARFSPGLVFFVRLAEHLAAEGVRKLHLGWGDARFKTSLATDCAWAVEGTAGAWSPALAGLRAWRRAKAWVKGSPLAAAVRLLRPLRERLAYGAAADGRECAP